MFSRSPLALLVCAGLLAAALGAERARGQDTTNALMRPSLDDPRNPQRFRRGTQAQTSPDPSRFGEIKNYDYKPAIGAGTTGFDSSGTLRKSKAGQKSKAGAAKPASATATATAAGAPLSLAVAPPPAAQSTQATAAPAPAIGLRGPLSQSRPGGVAPPDAAVLVTPPLIPLRRRLPVVEEKPFDPTGILVGSFLLRPAIEATRAYDTNPGRTTNPTPSWYWLVAPELLVNSNWARHELTANIRGSYQSYDSDHALDRPTLDARVNGRIDVTSLSRIDLEGRYLAGTDNPGSPNIQADLAWLPIYTTLGGTAGYGQRFNRFEVILKGKVDRTIYRASHFEDGSVEPNDDRNYNQYGTQLRTSYDWLPGLMPFIEAGYDIRRHDFQFDRNGLQRNSDGWSARVGSTFEWSSKLIGEMSVGYLMRTYQDPTLPKLVGVLLDGSLTWLASALTTAKLTASTTANETTVAGVSGTFTREVGLQVDHAFRRWLLATGRLIRAVDIYEGSPRIDYRYTASGALTYMLTREWQAKAEIRHEWRNSNVPGQNYTANVYLLGLRFQR